MLEWFNSLTPGVQASVIGGCATVIGAVITGVFSLIKRKKETKNITNIKQKQGIANKGTQIGIQNNINNNNAN